MKPPIIRSYQSYAPAWLLPIFDIFQEQLNKVLKNKNYCKQLIEIDFKTINNKGKRVNKGRKYLWDEVKAIVGNPLNGLVNNAAWYNRMLYHNILSIIRSRQDQIKIYKLLKTNNFKIDKTLRQQLLTVNLYPSNNYLKNLVKSKTIPTMPDHATAKLDYSVSDKQMFIMNDELQCLIKIDKKWYSFNIYPPTYIRDHVKKFCKPTFTKVNNQFVSQLPYYIETPQPNTGKNILGVDLGRVKLFSGTVLRPDGSFSNEFVPSNELSKLNEKVRIVNTNLDNLYKKTNKAKEYHHNTKHYKNRKLERKRLRLKRTRIKEHCEWLIAEEIVAIARDNDCCEIHLEYLKWVRNRGGKWDFSTIQEHIKYVAELENINVILVNPKDTSHNHPITKEYGKAIGRDIVFTDGFRVDRDQLASLNIALCNTDIKLTKFYKRNIVKVKRPRRRLLNKQAKQQVLNIIRNTQIVMYLSGHSLETVILNQNVCLNEDNNLLIKGYVHKTTYSN